jgi:hypothetical protein
MRGRLRDPEAGTELAHRQVRTQRRACDQDTLSERARPWTTAPRLGWELAQDALELLVIYGGERMHGGAGHCRP